MLNNVYPVFGAGIQTHDLWNITTRPGRCYISYLKNELERVKMKLTAQVDTGSSSNDDPRRQ